MEPEDVYIPAKDEVVQDPILHWAIRAAMNSIKGDIKLTEEVLADKSLNYISFSQGAHSEDFEGEAWEGKPYWIESLEGLQYATSITSIDIMYTSSYGPGIHDLSPLSGLTQLEKLKFRENRITDISALEGLVNLKELDLALNREIEDISAVRDMTKLESLDISFNQVKSLAAISEMENLRFLQASNNQIEELPDCSKLKKVYFLGLANNNLTDISALAEMKGLQELDLSGNDGITDIRPLAGLIRLEEGKTTLPKQFENDKDDLFAAIDVNKLFNLFNISKMKESDLTNVQNALSAYDALTNEQKTYFDAGRIAAARSNMSKVGAGEEPEYYPEYDVDGERQPVFSSVEIKAVDKYGNPMAGVEFAKKAKSTDSLMKTVTTDRVGSFVLKHTPLDAGTGEIVVEPVLEDYVAIPESITYTVAWGNTTEYINGEPATGLEDLVFTLIPKDEYVDKSELEELLAQVADVEEAYKYTENSYQSFEDALMQAKAAMENVEAAESEVTSAVSNLQKAYAELEKTDILTELKIVVKDKNGNAFTRSFEFQVKVPVTGAEAWNQGTDEQTSIAYLKAAPGWADGKTWEVTARPNEPYTIPRFEVTIGVKDGQRYFKTVDGKPVDVDFVKEVTATPIDGASGDLYTKPDSTVLEERIQEAKEVDTTKYTPASIAVFESAISDAESIVNNSNAVQEDYNAAAVTLASAMNKLTLSAKKYELNKLINQSYSEKIYTAKSWANYQSKLNLAKLINGNANATQKEVDDAFAALKEAANNLVLKADTSGLEAKIAEAKAHKEEDYQAGYEELQRVIEAAEAVLVKDEADKAEIDEMIAALTEAISALVKKPADVISECYPAIFRAKVVDKAGKTISGVTFAVVIDGKTEELIVSDKDGIITYNIGANTKDKTTYVKLADDRYTTNDEHFFTVAGPTAWTLYMTAIDGKAYADGTKLTYTLIGMNESSHSHIMKKTEAKEVTCTKDGNIEYYTCEDPECGKVYLDEAGEKEISKEDTVIKSNGHDYKWKVSKKATSSASGYKYGTCNVCGTKTKKTTIYKISKQELSFTKVVVNGEQQIPEVIIKDSKGKVLVEDVDYTLTPTTGGVEVGRYKMSIKYKGDYSGSKSLYFTVLPKAPASVSAELSTASSTSGYDDVKLTWEKAENASGYRVYYKKASSKTWTYASSTTKNYYTKKNLSDGYEYEFKVVSYYKTKSSTTKYYDADQYVKTSAYTLKKVLKPTVVANGENVEVNWTEIEGATGYQISQYSSSKKTKIVEPIEISEGKAILEAPAGKTRYYKVRAYREVNGKMIYAPWSLVKSYKLVK